MGKEGKELGKNTKKQKKNREKLFFEKEFPAIKKIGDWTKLEILVQNQSFCNIVGERTTVAPRNSGRDNAAGIMII